MALGPLGVTHVFPTWSIDLDTRQAKQDVMILRSHPSPVPRTLTPSHPRTFTPSHLRTSHCILTLLTRRRRIGIQMTPNTKEDVALGYEDEEEDEEEKMLKKQLKAHTEPGHLVTIAGPTIVITMWNMPLALQSNPTQDGISCACNKLKGNSALLDNKSLIDQVNVVLAHAREVDQWNRCLQMDAVLYAVFCAFQSIMSVVDRTHRFAKGKSFPMDTCTGAIAHSSTVRGFLAKGWSIHGNTEGFDMEAWRLMEHIPQLHRMKPSLYIGTSCYKVTVIDARSWAPPAKDDGEDDGEESVCKKQRKEVPTFPMTQEMCNFPIE